MGSSSQHHHLLKFGVEFPKLSGHSVQHNWPDGLVTECFALPPPSEVPPDIDIISSRAEHLHLLELDVSADVEDNEQVMRVDWAYGSDCDQKDWS